MTGAMVHKARQGHTKSRRGCLQCKKRHVKCNEAKPQCGGCERLDMDCTWPTKKKLPIAQETKIPSPQISPATLDHSSSSPGPDFLETADLQLLHYWYLNTSLTCAHAGQQYIWQTAMVELGFRHHFVLRGILATAAVHKATNIPDESEELMMQSSKHMDIAIKTFRSHLSRPDPATCVPVFSLACIIVMHRLGLAQVQTPQDPIEELCVLARLSKGIRPTVSDYWERILASEMGPIIQLATRKSSASGSFTEVLQLKDLVNTQTHLSSSLRNDCLAAIDYLHDTFLNTPCFADQAAIGKIFSWMADLSTEFMDLLTQREPVALVIVAHFAKLISSGGRIWYLRNWAVWILGAVEEGLGGKMGEWMEWPRREVKGESGVGS